jgi:hypothetical protein
MARVCVLVREKVEEKDVSTLGSRALFPFAHPDDKLSPLSQSEWSIWIDFFFVLQLTISHQPLHQGA